MMFKFLHRKKIIDNFKKYFKTYHEDNDLIISYIYFYKIIIYKNDLTLAVQNKRGEISELKLKKDNNNTLFYLMSGLMYGENQNLDFNEMFTYYKKGLLKLKDNFKMIDACYDSLEETGINSFKSSDGITWYYFKKV